MSSDSEVLLFNIAFAIIQGGMSINSNTLTVKCFLNKVKCTLNSFPMRAALRYMVFLCMHVSASKGWTTSWPTLSAVGKDNFVITPLPSLPFGWHGPSKTLPSHLLNMAGANDWPTLLLLSSWHVRKALTPFSQTRHPVFSTNPIAFSKR